MHYSGDQESHAGLERSKDYSALRASPFAVALKGLPAATRVVVRAQWSGWTVNETDARGRDCKGKQPRRTAAEHG